MPVKNKRILGIDIGGSKIRAVLFGGERSLRTVTWKTPRTRSRFTEKLATLIAMNPRTAATGVGSAGIIRGTVIVHSPNIPYLKNFDLRTISKAIPIRVENDARAFLRGEYRTLGDKPYKVLGLAFGTGIGRALIKNGVVMDIKRFEDPESWEKAYQKLWWPADKPALIDLLASHLIRWDSTLKPDCMILGGGLFRHPGLFRELRKAAKDRGVHAAICRAKLGRNSVVRGAALLFENKGEGRPQMLK